MTMHIVGPWMSTTRTKTNTKKKKWASAEQKRNALALEKNWEEIKNKHTTNFSNNKSTSVISVNTDKQPTLKTENKPKSLNSWITGPVSSKPNQKYTGSNVKGIVVQHKSCLQPVFNQQEAIDSATMRRG
jgi:hypothetical protein